MHTLDNRIKILENTMQEINREKIINVNKILYFLYSKFYDDKCTYDDALKVQISSLIKIKKDYENAVNLNDDKKISYVEKQLYLSENKIKTLNQAEDLKIVLVALPTIYLLLNLMGVNVFVEGWIKDFFEFLTVNLKIHNAESIIFYSLSGAFLYYLANYIHKLFIKFLFSIFSTVVLISLIFMNNPDGTQTLSINITPELLSFMFGYSTQTIFKVMKKMLDKSDNILE